MSGIHSWYSGLLQSAWVTSLDLHTQIISYTQSNSTPYILPSLVAVPWYWHLKMLGSSSVFGLHFYQSSFLSALQGLHPYYTIPCLSCSPWSPTFLQNQWYLLDSSTTFLLLEHSFCVLPLRTHFSSQWHRSLLNHNPSWLTPTILVGEQCLVLLVSLCFWFLVRHPGFFSFSWLDTTDPSHKWPGRAW